MQSLAIPRGQTALAGGKATETGLKVSARRGETEYGISSTAFLEHAFRTDSYTLEITFHDDGSWSYISDTMLAVRGREGLFQHRDHNTLTKVAEPQGNPLMRRQDGLDL
jgi:hypothetical protein